MSEPNYPQLDDLTVFLSDELPRAIRGLAGNIDEVQRKNVSDMSAKLGVQCSGHDHAVIILALMILMNMTFEDLLRNVAAPTTKAIN